jgi:hypothetical protein
MLPGEGGWGIPGLRDGRLNRQAIFDSWNYDLVHRETNYDLR